MDGYALLGVLAIIYAVVVVALAMKKPPKVWNMKKIKGFEKVLGVKGTVVFFYIWSILFLILGIWLLTK